VHAQTIAVAKSDTGRLKSNTLLVDIALDRNLWAAIEATLPSMGRTADTRRRYETSLAKLRRVAARWLAPGKKDPHTKEWLSGAKVSDLKGVDWKALAASWTESGSDWNHVRRAVSSFLTTYLGDVFHPFRREVMNIKRFPLKPEVERVPELSIKDFLALMRQVPAHARPVYWTLVLTGMRLKEYLSCAEWHLRPKSHQVEVPGTKTDESADVVTIDKEMWRWVELGIPAPLKSTWIHKYWWRACVALGFGRYEPVMKDGVQVTRKVRVRRRDEFVDRPVTRYVGLRVHDIRHFLGQWADDAGATESQIQVVLRHADPKMTRRYMKRRNKGEVAKLVGRAIKKHEKAPNKKRRAG
jgi:integrase